LLRVVAGNLYRKLHFIISRKEHFVIYVSHIFDLQIGVNSLSSSFFNKKIIIFNSYLSFFANIILKIRLDVLLDFWGDGRKFLLKSFADYLISLLNTFFIIILLIN
jgi:hypothetical protein